MEGGFTLGDFDLSITLKDAADDASISRERRNLARACICVEAFESYYITRELVDALQAIRDGESGARAKLDRLAIEESCPFKDRLLHALQDASMPQSIENLEWLLELLKSRVGIAAHLLRLGKRMLN